MQPKKMSRKYVDTSFTSFVKYKLNEIVKSEQIHEQPKKDETDDNEKAEANEGDDEIKPNKQAGPKFGSREYMAEMVREFNKIQQEYDYLHRP